MELCEFSEVGEQGEMTNGLIEERSESSSPQIVKVEIPPDPALNTPQTTQAVPIPLLGSLASQLCPHGPKDRCTPSQAQAMGQQVLGIMAVHESNKTLLPYELQNTFDIFHRCLAVAYGTFFLHLYTKANAPCVLCHGCKSLYPPGQYIHHACPALPPNIVPCRSRMWRRCLVPLMSPDMDKTNQKERWKFVLEKFSHASTGIGRRNLVHPQTETPHILEMPECKRGKFVQEPSDKSSSSNQQMKNTQSSTETLKEKDTCKSRMNRNSTGHSPVNSPHILNDSIIEEDASCVEKNSTSDIEPPAIKPTHKALGLIEELVSEIHRLEQELTDTQSRLTSTEGRLKAVTSGDSLSEQLVHSLLAQERITIERDKALKRVKEEVENSKNLEKQLKRIQLLHSEIQIQFNS